MRRKFVVVMGILISIILVAVLVSSTTSISDLGVFSTGNATINQYINAGHIFATGNISVEELEVRSGESIVLANTTFENEGHYTSVDSNLIVDVSSQPTAFIGAYAMNGSINDIARLILQSGFGENISTFNIVKSDLYNSSGAVAFINTDGWMSSYVSHEAYFNWGHFDNMTVDEYGNAHNLTGVQSLMTLNETSFNIKNGDIVVSGYYYGDGSQLRNINTSYLNSSEINYWTKTGNNLSYSSGNVIIDVGNIIAYGQGEVTTNFIGGLGAGASLLTGFANTLIGYDAGNHIILNDQNTFIGFKAGTNAMSLNDAVAVGSFALDNADEAYRTVAIGSYAGENATASDSLYLGYEAGVNNTEDDKLFIANTLGTLIEGSFDDNWTKIYGELIIENGNVTINNGNINAYGAGREGSNFIGGLGAGTDLITGGVGHIIIGYDAGNRITTEDENVFIGFKSGEFATGLSNAIGIGAYALINADGANRTVAIGKYAGDAATSSDGVYIGYNAGNGETTPSKFWLSNNDNHLLEGSFADEWLHVYGDLTMDGDLTVNNSDLFVNTTSSRIGIGTTSPSQKLDVNGSIVLPVDSGIYFDKDGVDGLVLRKSVANIVYLENPYYERIEFRHNQSLTSMTLYPNGYVGIGTTSPDGPFHVNTSSDETGRFEGVDHSIVKIIGEDGAERSFDIFNRTDEFNYLKWKIGTDNLPAEDSANFVIKTGNNIAAEFTILPNGNVGIGKTLPYQKLGIDGNVNISGYYYGDGSQLSGLITSKAKIYMDEGPTYVTNIGSIGVFVQVNGSWTNETLEEFSMTSDGNITYTGSDSITVFADGRVTIVAEGTDQAIVLGFKKNGASLSTSYGEGHVSSDDPISLYAKDMIALENGDMLNLYIANADSTNDITLYSSNIVLFEI